MLILFVHRTCRPREPSRDPERRARRHARGVGRDPFVSRRSPLNETAVSLHTHESHTVLHTRCYTHHVTQNTQSTTLCYTMCSVAVQPCRSRHCGEPQQRAAGCGCHHLRTVAAAERENCASDANCHACRAQASVARAVRLCAHLLLRPSAKTASNRRSDVDQPHLGAR